VRSFFGSRVYRRREAISSNLLKPLFLVKLDKSTIPNRR
jgi:hypothetical protein